MPFETSVEKPDLGILPLQVGFALAFTQIHKAHLTSDLLCNTPTFLWQHFYSRCTTPLSLPGIVHPINLCDTK
jgi:hypothetical protein